MKREIEPAAADARRPKDGLQVIHPGGVRGTIAPGTDGFAPPLSGVPSYGVEE